MLERAKALERGRPRVLVVDDIEANLTAMEALLGDMDCDLVLVRSGDEALRCLLRHEFAIMLLDVQMPEMDGYEVALHARQNPATRDVPILFLTAAHDSEGSVLRGYGSGAVDFLFKPLNPAVLRSKVRVFLELYAGRRAIADAKTALERTNGELRELADARAILAERFRVANEALAEAYRELQATQSQLVQSAKMASLGALVAGVAHEINNPLAFVLSHLQTVRRSLTDLGIDVGDAASDVFLASSARALERLSEMNLGLERIRDLVVKLRAFSRLDEGETKVVSMRQCVDSMLTILGHRLKDRIHLEVSLGAPDLIECRPALLNQAMMNLVTNAIDAIQDEGTLRISTELRPSSYVIVVEDSGHGIPEEIRERVLDPFFTTKPVGEGTGLGLSITYSIVRKHEGTLELLPASGGGTRAVVRLPPDVARGS